MVLVNFKIYKETFGEGAVKLARICREVMEESKVEIIPVVAALDAERVKREIKTRVFLQAVDEWEEGAKSGWVSARQAKEMGIDGAIINHSEHKLKPGTIKKMLKAWPKDFAAVVCLQTWGQAEGWARKIKPTMVAYEPPELIGNQKKSVASEKPEMLQKMVKKFEGIPILAGAGIKSRDEVAKVLKIGAKGVLLASAVVKSTDPKEKLRELAEGFGISERQ